VTYSYFGRNKIDLVQDEDEMLVWCFCADVLFHTSTPCTIRVTSVENMQNNIARVDDLVQLVPDTLARALHEDELPRLRKVAIGVVVVGLDIARGARKQLGLLEAVDVGVVHGASAARKIFNGAEVQLWPLALRLGTKSVLEGLRLDSNLCGMLLQAVDVALLLDQAHGQFVALHEVRRRVGGLRLDSRSERLEGILRDDTGVVEPLPVGLDAGDGSFARLVRGRLGDVSLGIASGLAVSEALEDLDLLCRSARTLVSLRLPLRKPLSRIPVKVLALDFDIAHAIARLALALLADGFLLLLTHGGELPVEVCWVEEVQRHGEGGPNFFSSSGH
jgi:hypothetical protein